MNEPHQDAPFEFYDEARARVDFPILDLTPAFRATDEFPLVSGPTRIGTTAAMTSSAGTLADAILEHGWLVPEDEAVQGR